MIFKGLFLRKLFQAFFRTSFRRFIWLYRQLVILRIRGKWILLHSYYLFSSRPCLVFIIFFSPVLMIHFINPVIVWLLVHIIIHFESFGGSVPIFVLMNARVDWRRVCRKKELRGLVRAWWKKRFFLVQFKIFIFIRIWRRWSFATIWNGFFWS